MFKKKIRHITTTSFFFILLFSASAQRQNYFSADSTFVKDLSTFMNSQKTEVEHALLKLDTLWNSQKLTDLEKEEVAIAANIMAKNRVRSHPGFYHFIETVSFFAANQKKHQFDVWRKALFFHLNKERVVHRDITGFLSFSYHLTSHNILHKTSAVEWKFAGRDFQLHFSEKQGLSAEIVNQTIYCLNRKDSIVVKRTTGRIYNQTKLWTGDSGMVTWERVGFIEAAVNARFQKYQIDMKTTGFVVDTVTFVNRNFFPDELEGRLEHKLELVKKERITFPRFESFTKHFEMQNIFQGVDYSGGFSIRGPKLIGTGTDETKAKLFIKRNDSLLVKTSAKEYVFEKEQVQSSDAEVAIYLNKDSIYHPSVSLVVDNNRFNFVRNINAVLIPAYKDTYHNFEISTDQIEWERGSDILYLSSAPGTANVAIFESADYFTVERYNNIQMYDREHPLLVVRRFAHQNGSNQFNAKDLANSMRMPLHSVRQMLLRLSFQSFITYNSTSDEVVVLPKTSNYLKARIGKRDYDVMSIFSGHAVSGEIFLDSYQLKINNPSAILLSQKGHVGINSNGFVTVKKNREIYFNGSVVAGNMEFFGDSMVFYYDEFKVDMPKINRIDLGVAEQDSSTTRGFRKLISTVENTSGVLFVDSTINKAGLKTFNHYPYFVSTDTAHVYYDKHGLDSVYNRKNFHFDIYPFVLDSLNALTEKNLMFAGELNSGGIIPIVQDTLRKQADYSLGFVRNDEQQGLVLYGGLAKFTKRIKLSSKGLGGDGAVVYKNVTMVSDDFAFYPDSLVALTNEFQIQRLEHPKFPHVVGKKVAVSWRPNLDSLVARNVSEHFLLYDSVARLDGVLIHKPDTLLASADVFFYNSLFQSDSMYLSKDSIVAPICNFKLLADSEEKKLPLETDSVHGIVDFVLKEAYFKPLVETAVIRFPENQFMCSLNEFSWKIEENSFELGRNHNLSTDSLDKLNAIDLPGAKFVSTHPNQDSLTMVAASAKYIVASNTLELNNVYKFPVADAIIYPNSTLYIYKDARIDSLQFARIDADTLNHFYQFFNATVKLESANRYYARGEYNYVDRNDSIQKIFFNKIYVNDSSQTEAVASISEKQNFMISPEFIFQGDLAINARKRDMFFEGYAQIANSCESTTSIDFRFRNKLKPDSIYIPVSDTIWNLNNEKIHAALMLSISDSLHIYPSFFNYHKLYSDKEIFNATGFLTYDYKMGAYKIATKEKLDSAEMAGNILIYTPEICEHNGIGILRLTDLLDEIKFQTAGSISYNTIDYKTRMETMLTADFFFNQSALEYIVAEINKDLLLEEISITEPMVIERLNNLIGTNQTTDYMAGLALEGNLAKKPAALDKTFVFSDLVMTWNNTTHSFQSQGKIGVASIGGLAINKYMNGYVELIRSFKQDVLNIYLIYNDDSWLFFSYSANVLKVLASDENFNQIIENLKSKERVYKPKDGESFSYDLASLIAKERFLRQFNTHDVAYDYIQLKKTFRNQTDTLRNSNEVITNEEETFENELIEEELPERNEEKKKEEPKKEEEIINYEEEEEGGF